MTERERIWAKARLVDVQELAKMGPRTLLARYEELCQIAATDSDLGGLWLGRQIAALEDVRDWLARLEE